MHILNIKLKQEILLLIMKDITIKQSLLLILAILLYPLHGYSQDRQSADFKVVLSNNIVTSIAQDSLGFMWLGTNQGICRFDGYSALPYELTTRNDLYINFTKHLNGKLYIGSNNGLFNYDYIYNKCQICTEFLADKDIISYCSNENYEIVATSKDVFLFDHSWKFINRSVIHQGILDNHIICMVIDANQKIWIGTESGLSTISIGLNGKMKVEELYSGKRIAKIFFDTHNNIWICRGEEILYGNYDEVSTQGIGNMHHIAFNHEVLSIFEYEDQVWIGTRGSGISVCEANENGIFTLKNNLLMDEFRESDLKNTIFDIYKDSYDNIWICTLDGLFLYDGEDKRNFHTVKFNKHKQNVPSSNIISSIYCDRNNRLWLATSNGINQLEWVNEQNYTFHQYMDTRSPNDLMANNKIQCITQYKGDTLLVSTKNTIKFFDTQRKLYYDNKTLNDTLNAYGMRYVRSTFRDQNNNIWLAFSESVGVINPSNNKFTRIDFPSSIIARHRAISRDARGNLWISSDDFGLYCLKLNDKFQITDIILYPKELFGDTWINALFIDQHNRIWVGTSNGLYQYKAGKNTFQKVEFPYSRKDTYIGGIIQDHLENIWAVGMHGIYKISLNDNTYYYELNVTENIIKTWYILGIGVNQTGEIFIGGVNGLNFFNPTKLEFDTYQHHINISDVEIMNTRILTDSKHTTKEINCSEALYLSYKDHQFSLMFSSMYYKEPMKIEYAYMLEGYDNEWIITDASRHFASYSNLEAGHYTFKVRSTNASGMWLENIKTLPIIVETAPWKSWWAYMIYTCIILGILALIARIYNLSFMLRRRDALNKWKVNYYTNLSYGLKVPLTLIYAPLQYLLKNFEKLPEADRKQMLYTMARSVSKLSEQVSHLIDFKKVSLGQTDLQLSKVDALPVIKGIYNLFLDEINGKQITSSFDSNIDAVMVYIDVTKIEIALYNIMEDAIAHASDNGCIEILCTLDSEDYRLKIEIISTRDKQLETKTSNLNTRFSIAYDYIKLHHNELLINSEQNGKVLNYTFEISLGSSHYSIKEIKSLDSNKAVSLLPTSGSRRNLVNASLTSANKVLPIIYLFEGDSEIDLFIKSVFTQQFDVQIIPESSGIKPMLDKRPFIVICDITKEEDFKFDICRQIKTHQELSVTPVIFISSLSTTVIEHKAYEVGADIFMTKPFDISTLETRIKQLQNMQDAIKEHVRKELIVNPKEVLITSDDEKFIVGITKIIEDNIANTEFNVDILAAKLNISRSTLYRRTLETINMTPIDMIRNIRMKRAASLLELTDKTVAEISEMVGYAEQRYFGRCFKKEYGTTPKQYAKSKKEGR